MDKGSMELGVQLSDTGVTREAWQERKGERWGKGEYSQKLGALQMASGPDS